MALTEVAIKAAKPREKAYRLVDAKGLHLFVTPAGGKLWRLRYHFQGKEKLLSLGAYPDTRLAAAREAQEVARATLRRGVDPMSVKAATRAAVAPPLTFETLAMDWYVRQVPGWADNHASDVLCSLKRDVFPIIGQLAPEEITPPLVLALLRSIEERPAVETAHRTRQRISAAFQYGIASGQCSSDPAAMVGKALSPVVRKKQPAITTLEGVRAVLKDSEALPAHPLTKLALRLLALTAVRPGELRATRWEEFEGLDDLEPIWRIPAERMKGDKARKAGEDHIVPLTSYAVEVIEAARRLSGRQPYVFPCTRHAHKPMSENAIGYLMNRAGYHHRHVPHGWRAAFSSIMNERHRHDRQVIDLMLAHVAHGKVEGAYNRAEHMERRRQLATEWGKLLLKDFPPAADLLPGRRK